ncbi:MAG: hypothetical protein R2747_16900 [Pyrinomonadaceae bacterium]
MKKKCPNCHLINYSHTVECVRCRCDLIEISTLSTSSGASAPLGRRLFRRALVFVVISITTVCGFYLSLLVTSKSLDYNQRRTVEKAVAVLEAKGFSDEVFLLRHFTSFRSNDNWLNASTRTETAYAATNYPFEVMTLYPEFFDHSTDDTERAAILLHEARHLQGKGEEEAYTFVWENRKRLGWTEETHGNTQIWKSVKKQTMEYAPKLFICDFIKSRDCTESDRF